MSENDEKVRYADEVLALERTKEEALYRRSESVPRSSLGLFVRKSSLNSYAEVLNAETLVLGAMEAVVRARERLSQENLEVIRDIERLKVDKEYIAEAMEVERKLHEAEELRREIARRDNAAAIYDDVARIQAETIREEEKLKRETIRAKRRELKRKDAQIPVDKDAERRAKIRMFIEERLSEHFEIQHLREEETRLVNEIVRRCGNKLTPAAKREIENLRDVVQQMIDEM